MKIAILNQFYVPDISPTAQLAGSLACYLAAAGHDVTVIASCGGYVLPTAERLESRTQNPKVHRLWTPQFGKRSVLRRAADYAAFYFGALWKLSTLPRQDVIVSLTTPPWIACAAVVHKLLRRSRPKIVLWNMDCYPEVAERAGAIAPGGRLSRLLRRVNRSLFARIDHLICLDSAMADLLRCYHPAGRGIPTTVIPNWESAELFPADRDPGPWPAAEALGLADRFVVLYLGNMGFGHRFDTVLDLADQMRDDPVTFLFVGGGAKHAEVAAAARKRGLSNVVLQPYVPKQLTPAVMAAADCALITLDATMLGVMSPSKLHANLAAGLPVLYFGPPGSNVDEAIGRHECGISLTHGDPRPAAEFLRDLIADPQQSERLAHSCPKRLRTSVLRHRGAAEI